MVTVTIDGKPHQFPKGTNAARGRATPSAPTSRSSATTRACRRRAVCRQCLVDVEGTAEAGAVLLHAGRRQDGGHDQVAARARRRAQQMLEFTLLNHPIDCPICDKAGECTLQKHYFDWDAKLARNDGIKVHKAKVVDLGPHIVLDQERCILCTRCIRVCDEVAQTHQLEMAHRGDHEVLTTAPGQQARQPVLAQHRRRLPGRRADREGLPLHDARLGARTRRRRSAPAAPPAATSRSTTRAARSTAWCRASTRTSTSTGCATRAGSPTSASQTERLAAPLSGGTPVDWDRALDDAGRALSRGARGDAGPRRRRVQRAVDQRGSLRAGAAGVRPPARRQGVHRRPRPGLAATTSWCRADKNPNTAGAHGDRRGPAAQPARSVERPEGGRGHGADRRSATQGVLGEAPAARRCRSIACRRWSRSARTATRVTAAAHVALPLADVGRDRRHVHQQAGHGPAHARRRAAAGRRAAGLGDPVAPGAQAGRHHGVREAKAVFAEAKQKLPFMKDADWGAADAAGAAPLRELARLTRRMQLRQHRVRGGRARSSRSLFMVLGFVMPLASILTWVERRQSRDDAGPPRSQPRQHRPDQARWGIPHFVADAVKMIFKEDFVPGKAHKFLFTLAPIMAIAPALIVVRDHPVRPDALLGRACSTEQLATDGVCAQPIAAADRAPRRRPALLLRDLVARGLRRARSPAGPRTTSGRCSAACAPARR